MNSLKSGKKLVCFMLGILCIEVHSYSSKPELKPISKSFLTPIFQWTQLEFEYDSPNDRQADIDSEFFIPGVPAIIDTDVYYATDLTNHIYVTIPRFQNGSPAALGEVIFDRYDGNHLIRPYPSWSWHRNPRRCDRDRIVSVYRIQIDSCGRMWVLDTGRYGEDLVCPPQILAFDLESNNLVYRYEIPQDQYESRSIFVTPMVDVRENCRDIFVYAADCQTNSLLVLDVNRAESWLITDKTMYPYPNFGTFSILGDSFDLMDGILGMALSPYIPGKDRKLFFHAMSSDTENWVYTSNIRNHSRFYENSQSSPEIFYTYKKHRSSQSAAEAIDRNGIMYFGVMSDVTFNCWDTKSEYGPRNIKVLNNNKTTLQFASGVKIVNNNKGQELFVVTSRFQKIATETINHEEINFRILAAKIDQNIIDKCKSSFQPFESFQSGSGNNGGGFGLWPRPPHLMFDRTEINEGRSSEYFP